MLRLWRAVVVGLLSMLLLSLFPSPKVSADSRIPVPRTFYRGDDYIVSGESGPWVMALEALLRATQDSRVVPDLYYDAQSVNLVVQFQTGKVSLPDGEVGRLTWNHLLAVWQFRSDDCGAENPAFTDQFDCRAVQALRLVDELLAVPVLTEPIPQLPPGSVDHGLNEELKGAPWIDAPRDLQGYTIRPSEQSRYVWALEGLLRATGWLDEEPDSLYQENTRHAVMKLQSFKRIASPDGVVGPRTWGHLVSSFEIRNDQCTQMGFLPNESPVASLLACVAVKKVKLFSGTDFPPLGGVSPPDPPPASALKLRLLDMNGLTVSCNAVVQMSGSTAMVALEEYLGCLEKALGQRWTFVWDLGGQNDYVVRLGDYKGFRFNLGEAAVRFWGLGGYSGSINLDGFSARPYRDANIGKWSISFNGGIIFPLRFINDVAEIETGWNDGEIVVSAGKPSVAPAGELEKFGRFEACVGPGGRLVEPKGEWMAYPSTMKVLQSFARTLYASQEWSTATGGAYRADWENRRLEQFESGRVVKVMEVTAAGTEVITSRYYDSNTAKAFIETLEEKMKAVTVSNGSTQSIFAFTAAIFGLDKRTVVIGRLSSILAQLIGLSETKPKIQLLAEASIINSKANRCYVDARIQESGGHPFFMELRFKDGSVECVE